MKKVLLAVFLISSINVTFASSSKVGEKANKGDVHCKAISDLTTDEGGNQNASNSKKGSKKVKTN